MTVAEYVIDFISNKGVKDVFLVSGGGAMYLLEALGNRKDINYICNHHEQASAMAAEGYARVTKNFGVCLVSTGPATTNTLTGVECAWNDSIPVMFISGQANSKTLIGNTGMRQRGTHEANIVPMVKHITKYASLVTNPAEIQPIMEYAYAVMMEGRKGPVWIDIPLDIQNSEYTPIEGYKLTPPIIDPQKGLDVYTRIEKALTNSNKTTIILGAGAIPYKEDVVTWARIYGAAIVTTKNGYGAIPTTTPNYFGMIGTYGNRKANKVLQDSTLLIILGARLTTSTTGYNYADFATYAYKIRVDVDSKQLHNTNVHIDESFHIDIKELVDYIPKVMIENPPMCWAENYKTIQDLPNLQANVQYVNSYFFYSQLSKYEKKAPILVTDQGAAFYSWSQAFTFDKDMFSFTNGGFSPMGYGLPAAIGACIASRKPVILIAGDGGFELNIQELQTIKHYNLPILIFVFENKGYGSIKNTQDAFFNGHYVGSDPSSGVSCVSANQIALGYGIPSFMLKTDIDVITRLPEILTYTQGIVSVSLDPHQEIMPKVQGKRNADGTITPGQLHNMYPYMEDK